MIYVCSLFEMARHSEALQPGYLVSIVQPEFQPETPPEVPPRRHLRVAVHDITEPYEGAVLPDDEHVRELVDYLIAWPGDEALLIHCFAGISRSTAAALITLSLHLDEFEAARELRAAAPHAHPNPRIIALADRVLGREGRLVAAREAMGPGSMLCEGPLTTLPLEIAK